MLNHRALDASADHHFIFWMFIGWLASGCAMFALMDIRGLHNAIWPSVVVSQCLARIFMLCGLLKTAARRN